MVRIVCPNFQPPRSRHNSGDPDFIDRDLAKRTAVALATPFENRDSGDSEDMSYDSMYDSDGDHTEHTVHSEPLNSDESTSFPAGGEDMQKKRKQRRRERNKVSAQAYRLRRKEQAKAQEKTLSSLEERNRELRKQVEDLELKIGQVRKHMCHLSQADNAPTLAICHNNNNNAPSNANMNLNYVPPVASAFNNNTQQFGPAFLLATDLRYPSNSSPQMMGACAAAAMRVS